MAELREQVSAKKKEMERFLDKEGLLTFRGIDGFETEELGITTNKLADAKERRLAAQAQYEIVLNNIDAPLDDIAAIPEISSHPQLQDLRIAMIQAKRKLYDLQNKYGPKHNKVLEAKAQIQAIEGQTKNLLNEVKRWLVQTVPSGAHQRESLQSSAQRAEKNSSAPWWPNVTSTRA